jgi:hypothetical protein
MGDHMTYKVIWTLKRTGLTGIKRLSHAGTTSTVLKINK